jgi:cathepsin A (carboxypeptidase C)
VAEYIYHFLHEFFDANPQFKQNELYIFGESYGGHYAPSVANRVGDSLNLKGLGVGNGLTDPLIQYNYYGQV